MSRELFMLVVCGVAAGLALAWWAIGLLSPLLYIGVI